MNTSPEFHLTDSELRVLCTFFLSLPLPPLASVVGPPAEHEQSMDAYLEHAAQGLVAKGFVQQNQEGNIGVSAELAETLRTAAYCDQYTILSWHERGHSPRFLAFYRWEGNITAHEITPQGEHRFWQPQEQDMGYTQLEGLLTKAVPGTDGVRLQVSKENWERLLAARLAQTGSLADVWPASEEEISADVRRLASDVLEAPWVISAQVVYDSLSNKGEVATFVLGEKTNWLVTLGHAIEGREPWMWALEVRREALAHSARAMFAPLFASAAGEGES